MRTAKSLTAVKASKRSTNSRKITSTRKFNMLLLALCMPALIFVLIFNYLPMFGIVIAFKRFMPLKGIWGSEWVGLQNFEFFFTSQEAVRTIRNTVLYSLEWLVLDLVVGVLIAVLLYNLQNGIALKVYHTILMLPQFMSMVIVAFITYAFLSPSHGVLNQLIQFFGGEAIQWYSEAKYWPFILTVVRTWTVLGTGCLYYYAALVGIDSTLFEAAEIDGANTIQKTWYVAIPELVPIMVIKTILAIGGLFTEGVDLYYQIPMNKGLLYETTDVINTYTYRALLAGDYSKSSAIGLFQSVIGLILVLVTNGIVGKISPDHKMF